jgi:DNA repair protein RecN (Recombination protein N)
MDLRPGFSVITGETGAGKSILLGALSLVLGKRAEAALLRDSSKKCIIEAVFDVIKYPSLKVFFLENDLDYTDHCILRRELLPSGKSRAFVNDSPVTLEVLSKVSSFLIDIHSQHQTLDIFNAQYQLGVIDGLAGHFDLLEDYKKNFFEYQQTIDELANLQDQHAQALKQLDYNAFLLEEIETTSCKEGVLEDLESQQLQLENASDIIDYLSKSVHLLTVENSGIVDQLQSLNQYIQKLGGYGNNYSDLVNRLKAIQIEVLDFSEELQSNASESPQEDPQLLEEINSKLQKIYDLFRKHQVDGVADLMKIRSDLKIKVDQVVSGEEEMERQNKRVLGLKNSLLNKSLKIRLNRQKAIPDFITKLTEKLHLLEMPKAVFKVSLEEREDFSPSGLDQVSFMFSANSGQDFGPLKKVASGGELSRIMMSIKALLSVHVSLPTIIFDEIDTGVSGEVATKIAGIMKEMGRDIQLISITHLPQVAAKGDNHLMVFKKHDGSKTETQLTLLDKEQRVVAIAEMLGGKALSDSAIAHAKQVLA